MAEPHEDPFTGAKENLRDTVKWLATIFAALAAIVVAGVSLTGLSGLSGAQLLLALIGGGVGLICILVAVGVSLSILAAESFYIGQLTHDPELMAVLEQHSVDILPPEFGNIDSFLRKREEAIGVAFERSRYANDPDYLAARQFLLDIAGPLTRLVSLAHFELLRRRFAVARPRLFALAIAALTGLGVFAVFAGAPQSASGTADEIAVELDVGSGWSNVAAAFVAACGGAQMHRARLVQQADRDWVSIRLITPDKCDGVVVALPATVVVLPENTTPGP
jgi:hypothetical protein